MRTTGVPLLVWWMVDVQRTQHVDGRRCEQSDPNLLIRSYFTAPNLRLKTPTLTLVVRPLTSTEVC